MTNERYKKVLDMRNRNKTFREIGLSLGVSVGRAREIYIKAKCEESRGIDWMDGLCGRTRYALLRAGFTSHEKLIEAIHAGRFCVGCSREIGNKTIIEVYEWMITSKGK